MFLFQHLGSSIARTSTRSGQLLSFLVQIAESKVYQLDSIVTVNHDVLGLNVPMSDSKRVQVLDCIDKLLEVFAGSILI